MRDGQSFWDDKSHAINQKICTTKQEIKTLGEVIKSCCTLEMQVQQMENEHEETNCYHRHLTENRQC